MRFLVAIALMTIAPVHADTLVSSDCIHPSGAGHDTIAALSAAAFVAAP